jgi:small Trp-rich protein
MYFLLLGITLSLMKLLAYAPVSSWAWWLVLLPFALAVLWWRWADKSGYTKRQEVKKINRLKLKKDERLRKSLGLGSKRTD